MEIVVKELKKKNQILNKKQQNYIMDMLSLVKSKKNDLEKTECSMVLNVSITAALVGIFLMMVPIPPVQAIGTQIFCWGIGGAALCLATQYDENKKGK